MTLGAAPPATIADRALPGVRAWFAGFLAWMTGLALVAVWCFQRGEAGDPLALRTWILALMCFYLSLCNTFVPLPTAWIVMLAVVPEYALVRNEALRVLVVTLLATTGTVMANLNEYHLLAYLYQRGLARRMQRTRVYAWAARWFDRAPFQILTLIAFVPIPVDAVRWLAVLRGYSRVRYAQAYFVGRGVRYLLFAWLSVLLRLSAGEVLLIQAGLVALAAGGRVGVWVLRRKAHGSTPSAAV